MSVLQAVVLGITQGLTEFIPVSSTAHLLIMGKVIGIASNDKSFAFSVIVQLGTLFALLLFFWRDIWHIAEAFIHGLINRKPFENLDSRLGWLILVATVPALIAALLLVNVVKGMFKDPLIEAGIRLLLTAALLVAVEYFDRRGRTLESATWMDALSVGLFQVLAIFPGASRSGTTIAGGMIRGFDRPSAARFAFLLSGPIMLAAGAYESLRVIEMPGTHAFLPYLITGFVFAAVFGWLSIRWLLHYLSRHSLYVFAVYCAVLGVVVLLLRFV
jgi:undecaprenyl-diphosphatase